MFPRVDPIPLPAPVWLMKALSLLTLSLHFVAVQLLIGGLVMVTLLKYRGWRRGSERGAADLGAAQVIARRLPTVTTYVINLGVPPLLFAQVLYGRALYTSSVLIAVLWISVVPLLTLAYWLLYRVADPSVRPGKSCLQALAALVLITGIGDIYNANMTLMLRPEVWHGMYAHTATGLQVAPHDPTALPRYLFLLCGGLVFGGIGMMLLAQQANVAEPARRVLHRTAALFATLFVIPQFVIAVAVFRTQPGVVQQGLAASPLYLGAAAVYAAGALLVALASALQFRRPVRALAWIAAAAGILDTAGAVIYRDGIRDLTLMSKGFNVWDRVVVANWSVIGIFALLLVAGLGAVIWLLLVLRQAASIEEGVQA